MTEIIDVNFLPVKLLKNTLFEEYVQPRYESSWSKDHSLGKLIEEALLKQGNFTKSYYQLKSMK